MTKRTLEAIAAIRVMAPTKTAMAIARALGVSAACVANWAREAGIQVMSKAQAMKALHADPEFKAATAARMKALHADPEFKAKMKALHADPEFKAATAARMKALHADPEFKAKMKARMKALNADPEFKAHSLAARKGIADVKIPKWVPRDLWVEFLDVACESGEEAAAAVIRCLKREGVAE